MGRSFCRHCRKKIAWYDNIPLLSFAVLGGKCRHCKERISWQYPLVEFLTGALFALVGWAFFSPWDMVSWTETLFLFGVVSFAVVIAIYDAKHKEIPMTILWMAILWTGVYLLWKDVATASLSVGSILDLALHSGVFAALVGSLFFFLLSAVSREQWMGLGDAYVVFWMGLVLGVPDLFVALVFAFTVGALWGIGMMISRVGGLKSQVPFAPFLLFGMLFVLIVREWIPFSAYLW